MDTHLQEMNCQLKMQEQSGVGISDSTPSVSSAKAALQENPTAMQKSNDLIRGLIECVVVYDPSRVEIRWKCQDTLQGMATGGPIATQQIEKENI